MEKKIKDYYEMVRLVHRRSLVPIQCVEGSQVQGTRRGRLLKTLNEDVTGHNRL